MICPYCSSDSLQKRGTNTDGTRQRYQCRNCGKFPSGPIETGKESPASIILFDIETLPMEVYVWQLRNNDYISPDNIIKDWCVLSWSAKRLFSDTVAYGALTEQEAIDHDDRRMLEGMWNILDEADIVIGHNCVEESTLVLTSNLEWKRAGDLVVGEHLVGFEEDHKPNRAREIKESVVTHHTVEARECYKVTFDNGDEVITTPEHPWLKLAARGRDYRWCETQNLVVGQRVEKFFDPWKEDTSYEAGWLSGFLSGEGSLAKSRSGMTITFCQRPGKTLNQAIEFLDVLGIPVSHLQGKAGGLGRGDTLYAQVQGGKFLALSILGRLRIKRMIDNIDWNRMGTLKSSPSDRSFFETNTIVSVESVGIRNVAVMGTSTRTYFAAGYPMHNSDRFDHKKLNTRFIVHGMNRPMYYRTIDTLKVAKANFSFSSNKLDYINAQLGIHQKSHTDYELWKQCANGEALAIQKMLNYNINDVQILEELYVRLLPWIGNHPSLRSYIDIEDDVCGNCGNDRLTWDGWYRTNQNKYQAFRCDECGSLGRSTKKYKG
jgi:hypothetical protein